VIRYASAVPTMLGFWFVFVGQGVIAFGQLLSWAGPTKV